MSTVAGSMTVGSTGNRKGNAKRAALRGNVIENEGYGD